MTQDNSEEPWKRLVEAARETGAADGPQSAPPPPDGFVAGVRTVRRKLWKFAKSYLWRKWSLAAIAVALLLYLVAYLILKQDPPPSISPPEPPSPVSP